MMGPYWGGQAEYLRVPWADFNLLKLPAGTVVGVYNPQDPGAATEDAQQGRYGFNYGLVFDKAISMGHGQCPVKRYNHQWGCPALTDRADNSVRLHS
jgi:hypothetical protein